MKLPEFLYAPSQSLRGSVRCDSGSLLGTSFFFPRRDIVARTMQVRKTTIAICLGSAHCIVWEFFARAGWSGEEVKEGDNGNPEQNTRKR